MPSTVDILVRLRTATAGGLADLHSALRGLESDASAGDRALGELRGSLLGLGTAAIPLGAGLAASLAPYVEQVGAAGIATGAFVAAIIPQFSALKDATKASDKATQATKQYGDASSQAAKAQDKYLASLGGMPPVTRATMAALGNLTAAYQDWSNSLASDTMPVAIKGFGVLEAIMPRLTPLVKTASEQFDRLVTALGGMTQTQGFDRLSHEFADFTDHSMKHLVDELLHFSRVLSQGDFNSGPLHDMIEYAKQNAPLARETLKNLVEALANIGKAASDAGPGMLTVVNTLAKFVNALPPEVLTRLIQLYTALRLLKGTAAGVEVVAGSLGSLTRQLGTMTNAATNAGGGLAGLRAALGTLSTGTKVAGVIAVIAGIVLALKALSNSPKAAPDVAKLSTALGELGRTGKTSGEASRVFGKDFDDLNYAIGRLNGQRSGMDAFNDTMNKVFTLGMGKSNSAKEAAKTVDGIDKALASLVQNGNADLAAAALKRLQAEYTKTGHPASDLTKKLDDYKSALADAKFEQELSADSMGLFGKQAVETQKALDAQKQSADGLRQSIQALNDANRKGLSAESDFEQAIDDATAAIKGHQHALKMANGELDLNTQKARDAYAPLADLASKTDAYTASLRDQGKSWETVDAAYERGRSQLIKTATQMGLNRDQAKKLADQILAAPDKTAFLKGDLSDLQAKLADAKRRLAAAPSSKTASIRGEISDLQKKIARAKAEIASIHSKTVTMTLKVGTAGMPADVKNLYGYAHGGIVGAAGGGPRSNWTLVGEQGPELVRLAAGSTVHSNSDSMRMLSGGAGGGGRFIVENVIALDGKILARQLLDPQRELVRDLGGDVQNVYGRRS